MAQALNLFMLLSNLINTYIGIPWKWRGRNPNEGLDCWGLVRNLYKELLNIELDDYVYTDNQKETTLTNIKKAKESKYWEEIDEPLDFCVVTMSTNKKMHHVGLYLSGGVLHAIENVGVVYNDFKQLRRNGYSKMEFYKWNNNQ